MQRYEKKDNQTSSRGLFLYKKAKIYGNLGLFIGFSPGCPVSRVMFNDFAPQSVSVHVGVNFGCSDAFMAQHALDGTQVGSAFQQVGGEGMSECMWADVLLKPDGIGQLFDDMEDHNAGNVLASFADEHEVFEPGFDGRQVTVDEIKAQFLDGSGGDGDQPLLASFPFYFDESFVQIKVRNFQMAELGNTKTATI